MTDAKIIELAELYLNKIPSKGALRNGPFYMHLAWMCNMVPLLVESNRRDKALNWIGFIQGALWRNNDFTIEDLKEHSQHKNYTVLWSSDAGITDQELKAKHLAFNWTRILQTPFTWKCIDAKIQRADETEYFFDGGVSVVDNGSTYEIRRIKRPAPVSASASHRNSVRWTDVLWTEDECTRGTEGHVGIDAAWKQLFSMEYKKRDELAILDRGDCIETIYADPRDNNNTVSVWNIHGAYQEIRDNA